jgi:hypothetical protein
MNQQKARIYFFIAVTILFMLYGVIQTIKARTYELKNRELEARVKNLSDSLARISPKK